MCPEGSEDHISCGLLHKSSPRSVKCSPSWALYIVVIAAIAGGVICIVGVYAVWTGSRNRRPRGRRYAEDEGEGAALLMGQKTTAGARIVVGGKVRNADYGDAFGEASVIPDDDGPAYSGL